MYCIYIYVCQYTVCQSILYICIYIHHCIVWLQSESLRRGLAISYVIVFAWYSYSFTFSALKKQLFVNFTSLILVRGVQDSKRCLVLDVSLLVTFVDDGNSMFFFSESFRSVELTKKIRHCVARPLYPIAFLSIILHSIIEYPFIYFGMERLCRGIHHLVCSWNDIWSLFL